MKINLDQKQNALVINFASLGRTKQQKLIINKLIKDEDTETLLQYLNSFSSRRRVNVAIPKSRKHYAIIDQLAIKQPGSVAKLVETFYNTDESHKPISTYNGHLGVEIECSIPWSSVGMSEPDYSETRETECCNCEGSGTLTFQNRTTGQEIEGECGACGGSGTIEQDCDESNESILESHIDSAHYELSRIFKRNKIKFASIKTDGSIDTPDESFFPVEITVLTKVNDTKNLEAVCKLINSLGAKVNKSCGLHVHLDARHLTMDDVKLIGKKFQKTLPVLGSMVPKTRRESDHYCKLQVSHHDRYSAVNLTAYEKYKTIEIRLHSSTTDFNKINNWCYLLNAIVNSDIKKVCHDLNDLTNYVYLPENVIEYFSQRIELFSDKPKNVSPIALEPDNTDQNHEPLMTGQTILIPDDATSFWTLEDIA